MYETFDSLAARDVTISKYHDMIISQYEVYDMIYTAILMKQINLFKLYLNFKGDSSLFLIFWSIVSV